MITESFYSVSSYFFQNFATYAFKYQDFFLNRGLSFETSNPDFRDLLDDLFQMVKKIFSEKKTELQVLFQSPILNGPYYMAHIAPFCSKNMVLIYFLPKMVHQEFLFHVFSFALLLE